MNYPFLSYEYAKERHRELLREAAQQRLIHIGRSTQASLSGEVFKWLSRHINLLRTRTWLLPNHNPLHMNILGSKDC